MTLVNIDYREMRKICFRSKDSFMGLGKNITNPNGSKLIYIDNGSNVLAVAHLDSVQQKKSFRVVTDYDGNDTVYCPQLDDRLGVYILLKVLPSLGINVDVLLTDDEEIGNSTAQFFNTNKKYNWMFQFDRRLDDVVFYQYGTQRLKNDLVVSGFTTGYGSFSDICYLDHIGCEGFNIGTGYRDEHSVSASANMKMLKKQIMFFNDFYDSNKNKFYPYTPGTTKVVSRDDAFLYEGRWYNDPYDFNSAFNSASKKRKNKQGKNQFDNNRKVYLGDAWYHTYDKNGELMLKYYDDDAYISESPTYQSAYNDDFFLNTKDSDDMYIDSLKRKQRR